MSSYFLVNTGTNRSASVDTGKEQVKKDNKKVSIRKEKQKSQAEVEESMPKISFFDLTLQKNSSGVESHLEPQGNEKVEKEKKEEQGEENNNNADKIQKTK